MQDALQDGSDLLFTTQRHTAMVQASCRAPSLLLDYFANTAFVVNISVGSTPYLPLSPADTTCEQG